MENYHLYIITNLVNQKKYVGITKVGFQKRFEKHLLNARYFYHRYQNKVLYLAIRKHGGENFSVKFLAEGDDWNHLCRIEVIAIKEYNTFIDDGCGYNMTRGGDGTDSYKFTDEQLARRTERGLSEEHKANIKKNNARYWLGKTITDETINKIKKTLEGKCVKPCVVNGIFYGSPREASKGTGFAVSTIRFRCRNLKFAEYYYLPGAKYSFGKARPCIVNGMEYKSVSEASRETGIKSAMIRKRIKDKNLTEYEYI